MKIELSFFCLFLSTVLIGQPCTDNRTLWATFYHVPILVHDEKGVDLLDQHEQATGLKLSLCDWCKAAVEGTVFVEKDEVLRVLNYAGRSKARQQDCRLCPKYAQYAGYEKTGRVLWAFSSGFGKGVKNYHLVPFVTIAVDPSVIPYGSVLYVPGAKGVTYRNAAGEIVEHDGFFFAGDTGSKITGNHIDVFIGAEAECPFDFVGSHPQKTFEACLVTDREIIDRLEGYHR